MRQKSRPHVCRLESIRPSQGEAFYLRCLLSVRPASSFEDVKLFNNVQYQTYQEAAYSMGLFNSELECVQAFQEAVQSYRTPCQLRFLFVHMLVNECIEAPAEFWEKFKDELSYDYFLASHGNQMVAYTRCLEDLSKYLSEYDRSLADFGLPFHLSSTSEVFRELSRWYPLLADLREEAQRAVDSMTVEQLRLYNDVVNAVRDEVPFYVFLDGKAGTGKTHILRALCNYLRSEEKIVIATATSAFAAQLYDGGRTVHSAFKV